MHDKFVLNAYLPFFPVVWWQNSAMVTLQALCDMNLQANRNVQTTLDPFRSIRGHAVPACAGDNSAAAAAAASGGGAAAAAASGGD